jgi:hypothetical protein
MAAFSIPVNNNSLPPSPANVLKASGIARLLETYPNRRFVDTLTSIAISGAQVGFRGLPAGRVSRPNHSSAFLHPEIIRQAIHDEILKGRVKEVAKSNLPLDYFCSPIGLVPKLIDGIQHGWRVIFDLSCPEGSSVNDGIPKEYGTMVYETLNDAICLVAQVGKGAVMMKRDLKAAFRHIPIHPCDYWLLLFEWEGKFYVDIFLPFGLRTAPRIFNLFAEALHWVLETLYEWNSTHYLDDFLFVFPPNTDISSVSTQFDNVLNEFGLSKASEKDSNGCVVVHLGFEFDSDLMQVRLPPNKKQRALDSVETLLTSSTVTLSSLESTLGFLSHCCQVVPLGRPFLRNLFSQICRHSSRRHLQRIRVNSASRNDLRWWLQFLRSWSSISMIQLSRISFDVATDASGAKGIGGVHRRIVFSERIPSRHKSKKIDWKEMFAILHAFMLWHEDWKGGIVRFACDNSAVVDALHKHSIKGPAIIPLQRIFLIAAVSDIEILAFWIPSRENMVADAASRFDYARLADLGMQVSQDLPRPALLRQKLHSFFTTPSLPVRNNPKQPSFESTNFSAANTATSLTPPHSKQSHTGLHISSPTSKPKRPVTTSVHSSHSTSNLATQLAPSQMTALSSLSKGQNVSTANNLKPSDTQLPPTFSPEWLQKSMTTRRDSTSKQHSALDLPPFYDQENLHGLPGHRHRIVSIFPANTSPSNQMGL